MPARRPRRRLLLALCALALLALAPSAGAYWLGLGSGAGLGGAALMPAGGEPVATASAQTVTVSWAQSSFAGDPLGSFPGGGYEVRAYAAGGGASLSLDGGCAALVSGAAPTLQCEATGVPHGQWQFTITPVLNTFTGDEGARSATVAVVPSAPVLAPAVLANPTASQTTGDVTLSWSAVPDVTGYEVFRRTSGGTFDFSSPLNGGTPVSGTSFVDAGDGLSAGATYAYVVRAVDASSGTTSAASAERTATPISRPAAPTGVTATAVADADVAVAWTAVPGAAGYRVYRRTAAGAYDLSAPLNGSTLVSGTSFLDASSADAVGYRYVVRAVVLGVGDVPVESASSAESALVTADGTPPPVPTGVSVTSGGAVMSVTRCSVTSGTRYLNAAGVGAVGVSVTGATAGERVVLSATTTGSTPVTSTVDAASTTVTTTLAVGSLLDGTVTLTARSEDAAGNRSATVAPTNVVIKDVLAPVLTATYLGGVLGLSPTVSGASECGATVRATKVSGGNSGAVFTTTITSGTSYSVDVEGPLLGLGSVAYDVTSTDRAGNVSGVVRAAG